MSLFFPSADSEGSGTEMSPDQEARHIIKKIRRLVRLVNRKWVELNQRSNEWQHRIEEVVEVWYRNGKQLVQASNEENNKLSITDPCEGNPPVTGGFPSQRASNADNVSLSLGHHNSWGGHFKNTYELLNLRALKISPVNKIYIFQCMSKIFCVEFQRYPLKFHTKYLTHTWKDMIFIKHWNFRFKSMYVFLKRPLALVLSSPANG